MAENPEAWHGLEELLGKFGRQILETDKKALCMALCNRHGELCIFLRTPGAAARGINIAIGKAYTAAVMECSTVRLQQRLDEENLRLADFCDARFTAMPGGEPICIGGISAGGVGLSGCAPARDAQLAKDLALKISNFFLQTI